GIDYCRWRVADGQRGGRSNRRQRPFHPQHHPAHPGDDDARRSGGGPAGESGNRHPRALPRPDAGSGMTGAGVMRALAASFRGRRILWWLAAAALAVQLIGDGTDVFAIGWAAAAAAVLILLGFAVQYVELRTVRPVKSFLRLALASFSTGLL